MNAHINPFRNNKERRAFAKDCAKQLDEIYQEQNRRHDAYIFWKLVGFTCLHLNESCGFGKKRLHQFLEGLIKQAEDFLSWESDDIKLEMLDRSLRRIGVGEVADEIKKTEKACAEAPKIGDDEDD